MGKYLKIDKELIFSPELEASEKLVLLALMDEKRCSYTQIAKKISVTSRSVLRIVKNLEKKGIITHKITFREDGGKDLNEYEILGLRGENNE